MALSYFDCNVCVGQRGLKLRQEKWRSEDVLECMDRTGIAAALVYGGWAKDYAPKYGNERLMEELAKSERFYGCYTILPGDCGDFYEPEEMLADLRAKGMVAAKMFPKSHYYLPDEITMGRYYRALEASRIPLLVDNLEIDWRDLAELLKNHPALDVVIQNMSWSEEHKLLPYMKAFKNLHIELSCMQANYAVETLVETVGARRVLFGSGLPKMSVGAARAFIDYAQISDADKQLIAGGNLARLCGVKLPAAREVTQDEIAVEASLGKPMSSFVFDSHTHFLEDGGNGGGGFAMIKGDLAHMEELSDRMGVDNYAVAPWLGIWTDCEAGNEVALKMARRSSRVYPYLLIDPAYVSDIAGTAYHYHVEERFPAMKMFFDRTRVRYNDPIFEPWWKIADENHLFGLMDPGSYPQYLGDVEEMAARYPNVTLFLDHAAAHWLRLVEYAELAKKYDNLYLQLTYTTVTEGSIEYLCEQGLAAKTLYGTDAPMRDPRPQLGWLAHAKISVEDKRLILGENMRRIAARCFAK